MWTKASEALMVLDGFEAAREQRRGRRRVLISKRFAVDGGLLCS
jgi:hypothetical protein